MSRGKTSASAGIAASFLCGFALGPAAFLAFLLFERGHGLSRSVPGLALAAVLFGLALGVALPQRRRRTWGGRRIVVGLVGFALLCLWPLVQPAGGGWTAALVAAGAFGLLGWLGSARSSEPHTLLALLLGCALGAAACSAGLPGVLGLAPFMCIAALAAVGAATAGRVTTRPDGATDSGAAGPSALFLAAAAGATGAVLVRAYLPVARSLPYAASDLGAAFALGTAAGVVALRKRAGAPPLTAACFALMLLCLTAGFSLIGYPDLIVGESAALQASSYMLTGGRVFPMWVLASLLGVLTASLWRPAHSTVGAGLPLMAAAAGAAAAGLLGGFYKAPYILAMALALAGMLPHCVSRSSERSRGATRVRATVLAVGVLALVWCVAGDPHRAWIGLRRSAAYGGAGSVSVEVERATVDDNGLRASVQTGDVRTEFRNGNLARMERNGRPLGGRAACLTHALGLAFSGRPARMGLIGPESDAPPWQIPLVEGEVTVIRFWQDAQPEQFDLIVCRPDWLSGVAPPGAALSREGLMWIRDRLAARGVLSLWFPAGWVDGDDLRRVLATLQSVFPDFCVFVSGRDAVFIAGSGLTADFGNFERLFAREAAEAYLARAGVWEPADLLADFTAGAEDLRYLTEGVRPYTLSHPVRPPVLARDLAERTRSASLALLAQHRLSGPGRLLERMAFRSDAQRAVALRGFRDLYDEQTLATLRGLGGSDAAGQRELIAFLYGPLVRMDLFARGEGERAAQVAAAMSKFGLDNAAARVLQGALATGPESFELHYRLAGILADLQRPAEALHHYRRALYHRPDDNRALLMLGGIHAKLGRFREAATAAARVLEAEPDNKAALELLTLSRHGMGSGTDQ